MSRRGFLRAMGFTTTTAFVPGLWKGLVAPGNTGVVIEEVEFVDVSVLLCHDPNKQIALFRSGRVLWPCIADSIEINARIFERELRNLEKRRRQSISKMKGSGFAYRTRPIEQLTINCPPSHGRNLGPLAGNAAPITFGPSRPRG